LLALSVLFAACGGGGNNNDRELQDALETIRRLERTIADNETPQTANTAEAPPDAPPPVAVFPNLNLPLITHDVTFSFFGTLLRIMANGELQRGHGTALGLEWNTIATDVRSVTAGNANFYITNDNMLWGYGNNIEGVLGDGTGVGRDEPVFIMENVAAVYYAGHVLVYAIKTDGTLWTWGNGNFSPVHIADDAVNVFGEEGAYSYFQTSNGNIFRVAREGQAVELLFPEPAYDFDWQFGDQHTIHFINSERALIRRTARHGEDAVYEEIATGVYSLFPIDRSNLYFTTLDGTLWGMGDNRNGELGDGTRVPRNEPVQIAENISQTWRYSFLKQDGTFWTWNQNDPVPQQVLENVATAVQPFGININVLLNDGRVFQNFGQSHQSEFDSVRIPQTRTW
jgi:hypothetical protein